MSQAAPAHPQTKLFGIERSEYDGVLWGIPDEVSSGSQQHCHPGRVVIGAGIENTVSNAQVIVVRGHNERSSA